jgi:glycosyltransferase involved in cell wall biosynthesis
MPNPGNSIIRRSQKHDKLNILTFVSHERYEPSLCKTGHEFFSIISGETRTWNEKYSPIPNNYHIFYDDLPAFISENIDIIVIHNAAVQLELAKKYTHIPIINIFHTMPPPGADKAYFDRYQILKNIAFENVFISNFNMYAWNFTKNDCQIIHHGIDDKVFVKHNDNEREPIILSVANDYINRDWALGFRLWQAVTQDFDNVLVVGNTPGLSQPAEDLNDIIGKYNRSRIFLNTSLASPIPMALLEAMCCGCACVSTNTCMIPDIIEHGKDGFLCSPRRPEQFKEYLKQLVDNPKLANAMGNNARQKVQKMFEIDRFTTEWNELFKRAINDYR